jgi:T-complex protein 1 subunit eta
MSHQFCSKIHLYLQPKKDDETELRQLLEKCAATAMGSKLINQQKDFFSKMVVDDVLMLDDLLPLNMIGIKKVPGGALEVSGPFCIKLNCKTDKFLLNIRTRSLWLVLLSR